MSEQTRIIQAIRKATKRREKAEQDRQEAMTELRDLFRQGREEGIPITEIAREAGLSRVSVYDLLAQKPGR